MSDPLFATSESAINRIFYLADNPDEPEYFPTQIRGASSSIIDSKDMEIWFHRDEYTPIHVAAKNNAVLVLKELVHRGACIYLQTLSGAQAIHLAAAFNSVDCLKHLLDLGAEVDYRDGSGATPLHYAADRYAAEAMVALLEHGAYVNARDEAGFTPLHYVCRGQKFAPDYRRLSLERNISASKDRQQVVAKTALVLISHGAALDSLDDDGKTPFHIACMRGKMTNKKLVRVLVANGAHLAALRATGQDPMRLLQEADFREELEVVEEMRENWLQRKSLLLFFLGMSSRKGSPTSELIPPLHNRRCRISEIVGESQISEISDRRDAVIFDRQSSMLFSCRFMSAYLVFIRAMCRCTISVLKSTTNVVYRTFVTSV